MSIYAHVRNVHEILIKNNLHALAQQKKKKLNAWRIYWIRQMLTENLSNLWNVADHILSCGIYIVQARCFRLLYALPPPSLSLCYSPPLTQFCGELTKINSLNCLREAHVAVPIDRAIEWSSARPLHQYLMRHWHTRHTRSALDLTRCFWLYPYTCLGQQPNQKRKKKKQETQNKANKNR